MRAGHRLGGGVGGSDRQGKNKDEADIRTVVELQHYSYDQNDTRVAHRRP